MVLAALTVVVVLVAAAPAAAVVFVGGSLGAHRVAITRRAAPRLPPTEILAVLAYVLTEGVRSAPVRAGMWAVAAAVAAVVSVSRVYLGVHWVSDVIGGTLVEALWAVIVTATWRTYGAAGRRAPREYRARVPH